MIDIERIHDNCVRQFIGSGVTVDGLIRAAFCKNPMDWRHFAEIIHNYMPPYPREDTTPRVVVKFRESYLRYSQGPRQGYFWDLYGDDFRNPNLAFMAIVDAPTPPGLWMPTCFATGTTE